MVVVGERNGMFVSFFLKESDLGMLMGVNVRMLIVFGLFLSL